jgi:hypothetical protein
MSEASTDVEAVAQQQPEPATAPESPPMYEIAIDLPDLPEGELVQIPGLGTFENGGTYEISEEEAVAYQAYHATVAMETDEEGNTTTELVSGPALHEAGETMYGVDVTAVTTRSGKGGGA